MLHELRFGVQSFPRDGARLERIVLERDEGQVGEATVGLQISHEAPHPGGSPLGVGPHSDVLVYTLKDWPSQLERGVDLVNGRGPLDVKRGIIFRHGVLAIGLLPHFYISDAVATLFQVGNLHSRIVWRAVEHGDWNHRRKIVRKPATEENIKAAVLVISTVIHIIRGMPRINRRNAIRSSFLVGILRRLDKSPAVIHRTHSDLLNGIADAVADVVRSMLVASVRGLCHQGTYVPCGDRHIGKLQGDRAALGILQHT